MLVLAAFELEKQGKWNDANSNGLSKIHPFNISREQETCQ